MKLIPIILALLTTAASAYTVNAYLVRSYYGQSVSGQPVLICVYSANGNLFEVAQRGGSCPYMIKVQ
jgi:hypothetical protein